MLKTDTLCHTKTPKMSNLIYTLLYVVVHNMFPKQTLSVRERSGSVVECLTRDREATGSSLTGVTGLWFLSKTHLS